VAVIEATSETEPPMCPETRKGLRAREDPDEADGSNPYGLTAADRPDDDL